MLCGRLAMTVPLQQALLEGLDYLRTLIREGTAPEEARARLRSLQARYPDPAMDLLWEERAYDCFVHYDLLLHLPREGTVSLSFCADGGLPWPLRGVHRWSEKYLVHVNNTVLKVDQAIACLDFIWEEAPVMQRLVDACLIQEALEKDPVDLPAEELQRALDAFRRAHKLYKEEDTRRWMERRGLTHEKLERLVGDEVTVTKLRDRVAAGRVEDYFDGHRADFDTARIARLQFSDEESALRTLGQIRTGALDFYEAAERLFLTKGERPSHPSDEIFAEVRRRHVSPALEAAVFAAAPGDLLGPLRTEEGHAVVRVLSFTPARLDEPTCTAIRKILFEEWLEERRQAARIEWYWGNATRTRRAS
jgi:putative peptide maturation system protein